MPAACTWLVSLNPTVLTLVVSVRFTGRLGPQSQAVQRELAATSAEVGEAFTGMTSIKGLSAEKAAPPPPTTRWPALWNASVWAMSSVPCRPVLTVLRDPAVTCSPRGRGQPW